MSKVLLLEEHYWEHFEAWELDENMRRTHWEQGEKIAPLLVMNIIFFFIIHYGHH
jgi:hypothetical protein